MWTNMFVCLLFTSLAEGQAFRFSLNLILGDMKYLIFSL